jgi:hypothetical protein
VHAVDKVVVADVNDYRQMLWCDCTGERSGHASAPDAAGQHHHVKIAIDLSRLQNAAYVISLRDN